MSEGDPTPSTELAGLFRSFFGEGGLAGGGEDLRTGIELAADEARRGTSRRINVERLVLCARCAGAGGEGLSRCARCAGSGQMRSTQGSLQIATRCSGCSGRGEVAERRCPDCEGGRVPRDFACAVEVPAGVVAGQQLRLAGRGNEQRGGPAGDLYVTIAVAVERARPADEQARSREGAHPFRDRDLPDAPAPVAVTAPGRPWLLIPLAGIVAALLAWLALR